MRCAFYFASRPSRAVRYYYRRIDRSPQMPGGRPDRIMDPVTQTSPPPSGRLPSGELDLTGRTLADFHILRHLGQGGMGQVYLAEQISLKRKVALKILEPELAADPTAAAALQGRGRGRRPGHPRQHRPGLRHRRGRRHATTWPWSTSRAATSASICDKKGPPELLLALSIMRQVAAALQRASRAGHHPPRHQAGKHPADAQGRGQGRRLRPVALPRPATAGPEPDAERRDDGHAAVHEPGAGRGQAGRSAAPTSIRSASPATTCWPAIRRFSGDDAVRGRRCSTSASEPKPLADIRPDLPADAVRHRPQDDGQGPRPALPDGPRAAQGHRPAAREAQRPDGGGGAADAIGRDGAGVAGLCRAGRPPRRRR